MVRGRITAYRSRIREDLERAFAENNTPHEIAASFAVGAFITMLPTLGAGLLLFVAIVAVVARASKIALFASVLVFNPAVKWGVYGASLWLGSVILGPLPGGTEFEVSLSAGSGVLLRLLVGNFLLAIVASIVGYVVVLRLAREYRQRRLEVPELIPDLIAK